MAFFAISKNYGRLEYKKSKIICRKALKKVNKSPYEQKKGNQTNNPKQHKITIAGVVLILGEKPT